MLGNLPQGWTQKELKEFCQSLAKIDDDIHGKGVYHFKISPSSLLSKIGQAHIKFTKKPVKQPRRLPPLF